MDETQEREVARGLREGDAGAWRALYDAYAERVWRGVARLMGADSADVADVVQETFLAAARSAASYDPWRGSLWLWLWGIARRHVALHYRQEKRHDRLRAACDGGTLTRNGRFFRCLEGASDAPPELLAAAELATLVRAALTELPAEYEMVLTARYLDGESVEQIASQERSTVTAVRSRLARARQAFRQILLRYSVFAGDKGSL
ncbi:MAG TPA: sigma-70 family RNA polymerase sigma factor [Gemmataceae bacterium]|jgi:RNA polymerase sigma-70 factor (ECF subfamily)